MKWWSRTHKQWPHIGICHETYNVPAKHYETIYDNFEPFGMGRIGMNLAGRGKPEALVEAKGRGWRSMDARMGRQQ